MIKGSDFILLASKWTLLDQAGEATWRSAISRAYYGAFHCAQEFLFDDLGVADLKSGRNASKHFNVQQLLVFAEHPLAREIALLLQLLHERRNKADYEFRNNSAGTQSVSKQAHLEAVKIKDLLRQCSDLDETEKDQMRRNVERLRQIRGI